MCTLVVLRRARHKWPIILGANRDEMLTRAFEPPDRHWPEMPDIIGGWDSVGKGSWLAVNKSGLVASVMNRASTLGPHKGKRSRGELVIEALNHADASAAAEALVQINLKAYAPFNLFLADSQYAFWFRHTGDPAQKKLEIFEIPEGYSMLTTADRNDFNMPRVRTFLPRFETARVPDPEADNWRDWEVLLGNRMYSANVGPEGAMNIVRNDNYGTVCSHLVAIPSHEYALKPVFLFSNGRPGEAKFEKVDV